MLFHGRWLRRHRSDGPLQYLAWRISCRRTRSLRSRCLVGRTARRRRGGSARSAPSRIAWLRRVGLARSIHCSIARRRPIALARSLARSVYGQVLTGLWLRHGRTGAAAPQVHACQLKATFIPIERPRVLARVTWSKCHLRCAGLPSCQACWTVI